MPPFADEEMEAQRSSGHVDRKWEDVTCHTHAPPATEYCLPDTGLAGKSLEEPPAVERTQPRPHRSLVSTCSVRARCCALGYGVMWDTVSVLKGMCCVWGTLLRQRYRVLVGDGRRTSGISNSNVCMRPVENTNILSTGE